MIALVVPAETQHGGGGGGGHGGGGHFGGWGHSSSGHSGGHFGWLRFGRHSGRKAGTGAPAREERANDPASRLWNFDSPLGGAALRRMPPTLLWSAPGLRPGRDGGVAFASSASFASSRVRRGSQFLGSEFLGHRRYAQFPASGCFFNGASQVCFYEPFLSLVCFAGAFDAFDFGFGWGDCGGNWDNRSDDSQDGAMADMSGISPPMNSEDEAAARNPAMRPGASPTADDWDLGRGVFVLVLNNGASHAVTDYWIADGYLEYISPDGTRSHIPLDALDLESTVERNAPRGLAFVLRSRPQNQ